MRLTGAAVCIAVVVLTALSLAIAESGSAASSPIAPQQTIRSEVDFSKAIPPEPPLPIGDTSSSIAKTQEKPVILPLPPEAWAGATLLGSLALVRIIRRARRQI
jgi:hypothetical protein